MDSTSESTLRRQPRQRNNLRINPLISHSNTQFFSNIFLLNLSLDPSTDIVEPYDSHICDILESHYDCSKQHNLRQFCSTRVQPCAETPSAFESTLAIAKRLKTWTCEPYVKHAKFVCAQSHYKFCLHDCTDYHQITMERPRFLNPTECKHAIRHLNGSDDPELNAFDYSNSFTFFNDIQTQRLLVTEQPPFQITKLNTFYLS